MSCHSTATINNLLREGQTVNTRTSICSKSVLFTTLFTHFCFCGGSSDVFRESDKGYFSPTLSCYFPGSFVWLRDLCLSVLRGIRGTFEHDHLWTLLRSYADGSHTCVCLSVCASVSVCVRLSPCPWTEEIRPCDKFTSGRKTFLMNIDLCSSFSYQMNSKLDIFRTFTAKIKVFLNKGTILIRFCSL